MAEIERLIATLRRESRSLMQYVREVPPWAAPRDRAALADMQAMAGGELEAVDALGRMIQRRYDGPASVGPYPSSFTTVNDAAFGYVLPRIVAEQAKLLGQLGGDYLAVKDAEAKSLLSRLLELKRAHAPKLAALTAGPSTLTKV